MIVGTSSARWGLECDARQQGSQMVNTLSFCLHIARTRTCLCSTRKSYTIQRVLQVQSNTFQALFSTKHARLTLRSQIILCESPSALQNTNVYMYFIHNCMHISVCSRTAVLKDQGPARDTFTFIYIDIYIRICI